MNLLKLRRAFFLCLAGLLVSGFACAQDTDTTEVEIGFDDIEEAPPTLPAAAAGWTEQIHLSGRFDLNLEVTDPMDGGGERSARLRNFHKFLFLKVTPTDQLTLDVEALDFSYMEIRYQLPHDFTFTFGKIWVPFGATPFHHYYGGRQGDPFTGLLLPNVWSEFGASINRTLLASGLLNLETDVYAIRGFDGSLGSVLQLTGGGSDGVFSVGNRTRLGIGSKLTFWGSVLFNQFGEGVEGDLLLWGGDVLADYGLVDVPVLRDLRLRAAFARADIRDETLVDPVFNRDGWYYRYGDYAELTYRGLGFVFPRVRYGTIVDFDDAITNSDSHNWEVAMLSRLGRHILLLAQYQINLEEVNELDNDLFRLQVAFEF